jgi:hypothetical protein
VQWICWAWRAVRQIEGGMAAAKARGKQLGGNRGVVLTRAARKAGRDAQVARATDRAADLGPVIRELREAGIVSHAAMARALTERSIPTARGRGKWTATQVERIVARLEG